MADYSQLPEGEKIQACNMCPLFSIHHPPQYPPQADIRSMVAAVDGWLA
jgi:hypothetical protein